MSPVQLHIALCGGGVALALVPALAVALNPILPGAANASGAKWQSRFPAGAGDSGRGPPLVRPASPIDTGRRGEISDPSTN